MFLSTEKWRAILVAGVAWAGFADLPNGRAPAQDRVTAELSMAEFKTLQKELHLKNQPWATIPWKVSLTEARELAAKTKKPIFLVVNTGNCLGFV